MDRETKMELISKLNVNKANFEHIATTGKINGSLMNDLIMMLDEYERMQWKPINTPPEEGDRYLVIQDLNDGDDPITHAAEYDAKQKKWYELNMHGEMTCDNILFYRELPVQNMISSKTSNR